MKFKSRKKLFNVALATTMAAGAIVAVAPTQADAAKAFPDVTKSHPHYADIMNLAERGIINGYGDGTFKPGQSITRGHAAAIIARALGLETKNVQNPGFTDIKTNNPYYNAIAALANKGIINGVGDGTYRPNDTLTRGQMAIIIAKAFELKAENTQVPFTDINKPFYKDSVAALYENKVTVGKTSTTFAPESPVTRAELATFVVRAEKVAPTEEASVLEGEQTILDIKDGKVVTANGSFTIEGDIAKVFNADNAAALKNAKIELVYETEPVASLTHFAAESTGKVVGIKKLTLTAENTSFNAGGFNIPQVTVNANGVQVKDLQIENLVVGKDVVVDLQGVEVKTLSLTEGAKITLDESTKLEKITLPEGVKLEDIITNYEELKETVFKDVVVEEVKPETTNPNPPASGGGGGGGTTQPTAEEQFINSVNTALTSANNQPLNIFLRASSVSSSNGSYVVNVSILNGGEASAAIILDPQYKNIVKSYFLANEAALEKVKLSDNGAEIPVNDENKETLTGAIIGALNIPLASDTKLSSLQGKTLNAKLWVTGVPNNPIQFTINFSLANN